MKTLIEYGGQSIEAEYAKSIWAKTKGMRARSQGKMLFSFKTTSKPAMDMVGVKDSLWMYGMIKLSENAAMVVCKQKMQPFRLRNRETWKTYKPSKKVHYILESFEELDMQEGTKVTFKDPELEEIIS